MTENNQVTQFKEQVPVAQVEQQGDPILAMIQQASALENVDVAKVQALQDMFFKNQDRLASKEFMEDFAVMQGRLPRVAATKKNNQTDSMYAAIEDINKIVSPVLTEHGFGVIFKTKAQTLTDVTVEATLTHKSGHCESTILTMPLDEAGIKGNVNKTKIHATASAITYAKRYALCELLNISVGEQDNDAQTIYMDSEELVLIKGSITNAKTIEAFNTAREEATANKARMSKEQRLEMKAEVERVRKELSNVS